MSDFFFFFPPSSQWKELQEGETGITPEQLKGYLKDIANWSTVKENTFNVSGHKYGLKLPCSLWQAPCLPDFFISMESHWAWYICHNSGLLYSTSLRLLWNKHYQKTDLLSLRGQELWTARSRISKPLNSSSHWIILCVKAKLSSNFQRNSIVLLYLEHWRKT